MINKASDFIKQNQSQAEPSANAETLNSTETIGDLDTNGQLELNDVIDAINQSSQWTNASLARVVDAVKGLHRSNSFNLLPAKERTEKVEIASLKVLQRIDKNTSSTVEDATKKNKPQSSEQDKAKNYVLSESKSVTEKNKANTKQLSESNATTVKYVAQTSISNSSIESIKKAINSNVLSEAKAIKESNLASNSTSDSNADAALVENSIVSNNAVHAENLDSTDKTKENKEVKSVKNEKSSFNRSDFYQDAKGRHRHKSGRFASKREKERLKTGKSNPKQSSGSGIFSSISKMLSSDTAKKAIGLAFFGSSYRAIEELVDAKRELSYSLESRGITDVASAKEYASKKVDSTKSSLSSLKNGTVDEVKSIGGKLSSLASKSRNINVKEALDKSPFDSPTKSQSSTVEDVNFNAENLTQKTAVSSAENSVSNAENATQKTAISSAENSVSNAENATQKTAISSAENSVSNAENATKKTAVSNAEKQSSTVEDVTFNTENSILSTDKAQRKSKPRNQLSAIHSAAKPLAISSSKTGNNSSKDQVLLLAKLDELIEAVDDVSVNVSTGSGGGGSVTDIFDFFGGDDAKDKGKDSEKGGKKSRLGKIFQGVKNAGSAALNGAKLIAGTALAGGAALLGGAVATGGTAATATTGGALAGTTASGGAKVASGALAGSASVLGSAGVLAGRAMPLVAAGMTIKDAYDGFTDKSKQQETFNLKQSEEPTMAHKASMAVGEVVNLGGLVSGGASLVGSGLGAIGFDGAQKALNFDSGDIAKSFHSQLESINSAIEMVTSGEFLTGALSMAKAVTPISIVQSWLAGDEKEAASSTAKIASDSESTTATTEKAIYQPAKPAFNQAKMIEGVNDIKSKENKDTNKLDSVIIKQDESHLKLLRDIKNAIQGQDLSGSTTSNVTNNSNSKGSNLVQQQIPKDFSDPLLLRMAHDAD